MCGAGTRLGLSYIKGSIILMSLPLLKALYNGNNKNINRWRDDY